MREHVVTQPVIANDSSPRFKQSMLCHDAARQCTATQCKDATMGVSHKRGGLGQVCAWACTPRCTMRHLCFTSLACTDATMNLPCGRREDTGRRTRVPYRLMATAPRQA